MASINVLRDPLQGYDIRVSAYDLSATAGITQLGSQRLVGAFNSFMWRIISQTEAYIMLGSRTPRMLEGEIITVWSLDQGIIDPNVVANTFGKAFADALALGRGTVIPRQARFNLVVNAGANTMAGLLNSEATFNPDSGDAPALNVTLKTARVDTLTFGVAPGRAVAANSWQGTAEGVDDSTATVTPP